MLRSRVIPIILIKDGYVVKSINFKNLKYIGEPINIVKIFNDKEADEIVVYDIGCYNSNINFDLIKNIAAITRMPFCYGGGLKKIDDIKKIFSYGIEKVSLNSIIFDNINFVKEVSKLVGNQSTVITLDINLGSNGYYIEKNNIYLNEIDMINLIRKLEDLGAGEIIINCIHSDGTMKGFDTKLLDKLYNLVTTPITLVGGASSYNEINSISNKYKYLGIGVGSLFIYKGINRAVLINYPEELTKKF